VFSRSPRILHGPRTLACGEARRTEMTIRDQGPKDSLLYGIDDPVQPGLRTQAADPRDSDGTDGDDGDDADGTDGEDSDGTDGDDADGDGTDGTDGDGTDGAGA
jgi:hypothetical protein